MRVWCAAALLCCLTGCAADRDDAVGATTTSSVPAVGVSTLAALTSTAATTATTATTAAADLAIELFEFQPEVTVSAGQPFTIANRDGADHTLTDRENTFESYVPARATTTLTIDTPGTYEIWCRIHPSMTATIVVV